MRTLLLLASLASAACAAPSAPGPVPSLPSPGPSLPPPGPWAGSLRFCPGDVDPAVVAWAAGEVSRLTHRPLVDSGPCTVTFTREPLCGLHPCTDLDHFVVHLPRVERREVLHEMGHLMLGAEHSGSRSDLMYATPEVDTFSSAELARLRVLFPGH